MFFGSKRGFGLNGSAILWVFGYDFFDFECDFVKIGVLKCSFGVLRGVVFFFLPHRYIGIHIE